MAKVSESQQILIDLIKKRGELTLNEAITLTELAKTTLREHFTILEKDGFIVKTRKREGRGRPELVFKLTEKGHRLFPSRDGIVLKDFLHFLKDKGHTTLIDEFFQQYWETRYKEIKHQMSISEDDSLDGQLKILQDILEEQGFMPEIQLQPDKSVVIQECNCPFSETIKETHLPCKLEALFLEKILNAEMKRVSHIGSGNPFCIYELSEAATKHKSPAQD